MDRIILIIIINYAWAYKLCVFTSTRYITLLSYKNKTLSMCKIIHWGEEKPGNCIYQVYNNAILRNKIFVLQEINIFVHSLSSVFQQSTKSKMPFQSTPSSSFSTTESKSKPKSMLVTGKSKLMAASQYSFSSSSKSSTNKAMSGDITYSFQEVMSNYLTILIWFMIPIYS